MYLGRLGGAINLRMLDGTVQTFTAITPELDRAIKDGGQSTDGKRIDEFMGGYLIGGCPLNVYLGMGWLPGQQQALIDAGRVECVPGYENIGQLQTPPPTTVAIAPPVSSPITVQQQTAPLFQQPGPMASGGGFSPSSSPSQPYPLPLNISPNVAPSAATPPLMMAADAGTPWYIVAGLAIGLLAVLRR